MPHSTRRPLLNGIGVTAIIGGLLLSGSYSTLTLLAPLPAVTPTITAPAVSDPVEPQLALPGFGGSAIAALGYPDAVVTHGAEEPLELASITKVITALVVLEAKPLETSSQGPTLTFGSYDVDRYHHHIRNNGGTKSVWAGLQLSERAVLELVLISSANNYADSLAVWAFGSIDRFAARANAWLAENGMTSTRVVEPSGLDRRNTATTTDLLTLARLAHAHPVVSSIVATPSSAVSGLGGISNTNKLLGTHGIDGIKTGTLDTHNLLFSADVQVQGRVITVVGVVLGAASREQCDEAVRRLVGSISDGFEQRELIEAGTIVGTYRTPWGDEARAVTASSASVLAWRGSDATSSLIVHDLIIGDSTRAVGQLEFLVGSHSVMVPVVLKGTIDDPGWWWRLVNPAALL